MVSGASSPLSPWEVGSLDHWSEVGEGQGEVEERQECGSTDDDGCGWGRGAPLVSARWAPCPWEAALSSGSEDWNLWGPHLWACLELGRGFTRERPVPEMPFSCSAVFVPIHL